MKGSPQPDFRDRSPEALEEHLKLQFEDVDFAVSTEPLDLKLLPDDALDVFSQYKNDQARKTWLLGRSALYRLAEKLGLGRDDTMMFRGPHKSISLTHKTDIAIACSSQGDHSGIGVDYEPLRKLPLSGLQHLLNPNEREAIESGSLQDSHVLALWTVKESLFKSMPENQKVVLPDFVLDDPTHLSGVARHKVRENLKFVYESVPFRDGFLSVARSYLI